MGDSSKRKFDDTMDSSESDSRPSPFLPMFETFRSELDQHHDRRDRIGKASRDITAASKKIIFALQRLRNLNQPLPDNITNSIQPQQDTIAQLFSTIAPELQSINAYRYNRQVSPGIQEYMEARIFQHYLTTQTLLTYTAASADLNALATPPQQPPTDPASNAPLPHLLLTPEDYLLGIFDATGELMRFAITNMATAGALPTTATTTTTADAPPQRTVLHDLQALRNALCTLEARADFDFHMGREVRSKMGVMLASVDKVERALYGLIVRGSERPKGWMPDLTTSAAAEVDVEG